MVQRCRDVVNGVLRRAGVTSGGEVTGCLLIGGRRGRRLRWPRSYGGSWGMEAWSCPAAGRQCASVIDGPWSTDRVALLGGRRRRHLCWAGAGPREGGRGRPRWCGQREKMVGRTGPRRENRPAG